MPITPDDFENDSQPNYRERAEPVRLLPTPPQPAPALAGMIVAPAAERAIRARRLRTEEGRIRLLDIDQQAGRSLITIKGIAGMAGSFEAQYPTCPHCETVVRREIRNPALEAMIVLFTGTKRIVWAVTITCDDCLQKEEAKTAANKADAKRAHLESCGLTKAMLTWTLSTYPNQRSEWLKRATDYAASGVQHDVVIWGNPGVGKTGLGVGILRDVHERTARTIRFIRATEFMLMLRDAMKPKGMDGLSEMAVIQLLASVDVLMIDDVSTIGGTDYQDEIMSFLIDMRQKDHRPTILTLNLKVARGGDPSRALVTFFGERVFDRLREYGEEWHMSGQSMRQGR